jgi:hypothetical protein
MIRTDHNYDDYLCPRLVFGKRPVLCVLFQTAVSNMAFQVGSPGSTNNGNRGLEQIGSPTRWFMQLCFVVFWGAWGFHMWRDPAHFGLKGDAVNCETNYNVTLQLFTEVRPTDPRVRAAALSLISIGFVLAILSLFFSLEECLAFVSRPFEQCGKRCGKRNGKNGDNGDNGDNGEIGSGRDSGKDGENQEINARGMTTPLYDKPRTSTLPILTVPLSNRCFSSPGHSCISSSHSHSHICLPDLRH